MSVTDIMAFPPLERFVAEHRALVDRLYERSGAGRWSLDRDAFGEALYRSAAARFRPPASCDTRQLTTYLETLHLEDMALACACGTGSSTAWDHFVASLRPELYGAARAIAGVERARELADSLYSELYGVDERGNARATLFRYFHGRSRLTTWLRAVLAQRYVDMTRRERHLVPLDEADPPSLGPNATSTSTPGANREEPSRSAALLQVVITAAIAALPDRDRLRLAGYYVHDLTLAQLGRMLGEHEATVSRKLQRTRVALRKDAETRLRRDHGLDNAQIELCFESARGEWQFDLGRALEPRKINGSDRSKHEEAREET